MANKPLKITPKTVEKTEVENSVEVSEKEAKVQTVEPETKSIDIESVLSKQSEMEKLISEQSKLIEMLQNRISQPQQNIISLEGLDKVTVVHLKNYPTSIKLSTNKVILLTKIRQTQEVTRSEALELVNTYPKAFEKGWITLTGEIGQQILEANNILIDAETINSIFNYQDAINLEKDEIVKYYEELMPAQKDMFVTWWYNEAAADKEEFLNLEVVNSLNKISGGKFSKLIKDKITNVM